MSKKLERLDHKAFEEKVKILLDSLGIPCRNISPYTLAFVHRSVLNERTTHFSESNERLEFLGDAVLELIITEILFHKYPEKDEGKMTDIRSALVRGKNLAIIALRLGLEEYILLSRWEVLADGKKNPYILANTFEAFLGAIYLDNGFELAKKFIEEHVASTLDEILDKRLYIDPKSYLQEFTQAKYLITPTYEVHSESGLDHNKNYEVGVCVGAMCVGIGFGSSKKKAQEQAAENAIGKIDEWEGKIEKVES